jgi:hypothetical protein
VRREGGAVTRVGRDVLNDGRARRPEKRTDAQRPDGGATYHHLVDPPSRTSWVSVNTGRGIDYVEVPDERPARSWGREAIADGVGAVWIVAGAPIALAALWIAVSYVVMLVGWATGSTDLHAFPELLLIPTSCAPQTSC